MSTDENGIEYNNEAIAWVQPQWGEGLALLPWVGGQRSSEGIQLPVQLILSWWYCSENMQYVRGEHQVHLCGGGVCTCMGVTVATVPLEPRTILARTAGLEPRAAAALTSQAEAGRGVLQSSETMAVTQGIISNEREAVKPVVLSSHGEKVGCRPN